MGCLNMSLLQIYHWICQWKNFETLLTFGEAMGRSFSVLFFLTHDVVMCRVVGVQLWDIWQCQQKIVFYGKQEFWSGEDADLTSLG